MRKSQIYSQVIVYLLTMVLVAFILVYGYKTIQNFKKRADQVSCVQFKNDLSNAIESISSEYGSVKRKDLEMCSGFSQVCLVESVDSVNLPAKIDPIIKDNILSNTGRNAFLVETIAKDSFFIGRISVDPDILCIKAVRNRISLRLEGKGDHAFLSEWT